MGTFATHNWVVGREKRLVFQRGEQFGSFASLDALPAFGHASESTEIVEGRTIEETVDAVKKSLMESIAAQSALRNAARSRNLFD